MKSIGELWRKDGVARLPMFGSMLRGDFGTESVLDSLVFFRSNDNEPLKGKLMDLELEVDLGALLSREVNVDIRIGVM